MSVRQSVRLASSTLSLIAEAVAYIGRRAPRPTTATDTGVLRLYEKSPRQITRRETAVSVALRTYATASGEISGPSYRRRDGSQASGIADARPAARLRRAATAGRRGTPSAQADRHAHVGDADGRRLRRDDRRPW